MPREANEVLSALVDGETVDPYELAGALESPDAHALLVDFLRLRQELRDAEPDGPAELTVARLRRQLEPRRGLRPLRALAAAAVVMLAIVGVLSLGERALGPAAGQAPPQATREIRFERGVDWRTLEPARP